MRIKLITIKRSAISGKIALNRFANAIPDHIAHRLRPKLTQPLAAQNRIERGLQIGR